MESLESGLQNLYRLPKKQDSGRHACQHVEGVERPERHPVVNLFVCEAVVGTVEGVPAVGGVQSGESGDGQSKEGE